jgi:hypothetical protein
VPSPRDLPSCALTALPPSDLANVVIATFFLVETVLDEKKDVGVALGLVLGSDDIVAGSAGAERLRPLNFQGRELRFCTISRDDENIAFSGVRHCEDLDDERSVEVR